MTGIAEPRLEPFDKLLTGFVAERKIPGAALAVTRQGRLVYARGFGYANVADGEPVQPEALFRIASISKTITAIGILKLVEQKKLSLDDAVCDILKIEPRGLADKPPDLRLLAVTIRQLLEHTGGWDRDKSFDPMFRSVEIANDLGTSPPARPDDVIRYMLGVPLDFGPGTRYAYSNFGYCLLGRVIESLSGEPYETYIQSQVLKPLGITRMRLGKTLPEERASGEVRYYETSGKVGPAVIGDKLGEPVPLPYGGWYLEAMDSHGGWLASATDLVRLASAFDDPDKSPSLARESITTMFARPSGAAGFEPDGKLKRVFYSLGWFGLQLDCPVRSNHWHTGSLDGTSTMLVRRHDGLNWAILFNTRNGPNNEVPSRAIDGLLHKAADAVREWPDIDLFKMRADQAEAPAN